MKSNLAWHSVLFTSDLPMSKILLKTWRGFDSLRWVAADQLKLFCLRKLINDCCHGRWRREKLGSSGRLLGKESLIFQDRGVGRFPYFTLLWARISQRKGRALPPLEVLVVGQGFLLLLRRLSRLPDPGLWWWSCPCALTQEQQKDLGNRESKWAEIIFCSWQIGSPSSSLLVSGSSVLGAETGPTLPLYQRVFGWEEWEWSQLEKITHREHWKGLLFSQEKTERRYTGKYVKANGKEEGNKCLWLQEKEQ